jgi:hypothetical protein
MGLPAWLLTAIALLVLPGCNEVTAATTGPLILSITSVDEPLGERVPLEGALLCETDTSNCARSRADGQARIELPIGEETSITLEKDGYPSYLVPVLISERFDNPFEMYSDQHMVVQFDRVMSDYPMRGTGTILIVLVPNSEGATFELVNATGERFYTDEGGLWSLDLTETREGRYRQDSGGFVNVTPGDEYWVRFGGSAQNCTTSWGWPGDDQNRFRVPVREGYVSNLRVVCPQP